MIERVVDPALDNALDIGEIDHHSQLVEAFRSEVDGHLAVMAVRHTTFSLILHETVTVAEVKFLRHYVHDGPISCKFFKIVWWLPQANRQRPPLRRSTARHRRRSSPR